MELTLFYVSGENHPIIGQVYYTRQKFKGGNEVVRYQRYLANILTFIAQSSADCDRILSQIEKVEIGRENRIEVEGNDVEVELLKTGIQVDITVNDDWTDQPEGRFSLAEFKAVIIAWRQFLQLPESLDSKITIEL